MGEKIKKFTANVGLPRIIIVLFFLVLYALAIPMKLSIPILISDV